MADLNTFLEAFEETYYDLPRHEQPYFALLVLRAARDKIRDSIKDRPTGAEKEQALLVVQKYDETIAELERLFPPPREG